MSNQILNIKNAVAAALLSASFAAAAAEPYFGGSFAVVDYSVDGISSDASLNAIYGRGGLMFNDNISGEVRLGFGIGDDSINAGPYEATIELKNMIGAYVRGGIPVGESFYPYAIIGYTRAEADTEISGPDLNESSSESESDLSFGVGADFSITETLKVNGEYMTYFDKDGAELSGFSIGVAKSF